MFYKIALILGLGLTPLGHTITAAHAENAAAMKPAGGAYKAVSDLVTLPNHIPGIGTLFVDPKTLPAGPFAAYNKTGKLVSTIYMIPLKEMQAKKSLQASMWLATPPPPSTCITMPATRVLTSRIITSYFGMLMPCQPT